MQKQNHIKSLLLIFHGKTADSPYLQATLPSLSPIVSPGKLLSMLHVTHRSNITYILQLYEPSCFYLLKKKVSTATVTPKYCVILAQNGIVLAEISTHIKQTELKCTLDSNFPDRTQAPTEGAVEVPNGYNTIYGIGKQE